MRSLTYRKRTFVFASLLRIREATIEAQCLFEGVVVSDSSAIAAQECPCVSLLCFGSGSANRRPRSATAGLHVSIARRVPRIDAVPLPRDCVLFLHKWPSHSGLATLRASDSLFVCYQIATFRFNFRMKLFVRGGLLRK